MNKIVTKRQLSENVWEMEVEAAAVAKARKPGQFIILQVDEMGERIPLTIADADPIRGTVKIIFQTVGATTQLLSRQPEGGALYAFVGPLGNPTVIEPGAGRRVVCVGGGIGVAPMHPIAQGFKSASWHVTVILGARSRDLIIMEEAMRAFADEVIIMTDDGSAGRKGLVTEPLKELCAAGGIDEVVTIGPPIMMKFCAETTRPFAIKTIASLNSIMIDGTGMCGGCRVSVGGKTRFVCVDGPEFDAHQVDFDLLMARNRSFQTEEKHKCQMQLEVFHH